MSAHNSFEGRRHALKGLAALVLVLTACIYLVGLDSYPLLDPDEGRYAEIPREMLESGDFIIPRLNYVPYLEKPPLFYWCSAGVMALFGTHEWTVRIMPALAGFLTISLIMGFGYRFFGPAVGVLAGWVYLTSLLSLILARLPIIDGFFTFILTATWMTWWAGYRAGTGTRRDRWHMLSWACLGLAVMTKGIAAIALTGLIVFAFIALKSDWSGLRDMCWVRGLLIFSVIVLPWHLIAGFRHPEFFHFYVVVQHFERLVSAEHARPFWYLPVIFPLGMLFWTALFFPTALWALRKSRTAVLLPWRRWRAMDRPETAPASAGGLAGDRSCDGILFLTIWAGVVVGLFSLSRSKLVPYILPAYPAVALLVALYLTEGGTLKRSSKWCAGLTAIILLAAIPAVSYYIQTQEMLPREGLAWALTAAQGGLALGSICLGWAVFRPSLIVPATGLALVFLVPAMILAIPMGAEYRKVGGLLKGIPTPLPEAVQVAEWRNFDQGLSFYTKRRTILVDHTGELKLGRGLEGQSDFFLEGDESLRGLAAKGPLLVNLRPGDWPKVRQWGLFHLMAANSTNVMVGNEAFFRLACLVPWPDDTNTAPPVLLRPRPLNPRTNR